MIEQQEGVAAGDPQQIVGEARDHAGERERADQQAAAGEDRDQFDEGLAVQFEEVEPARAAPVLAGEEFVERGEEAHAPQTR